MGNCLIRQGKVIKVMKTDGKVLEYETPMKVHQVLSEHTGHAISDALPVVRHLRLDEDMVSGQLYYLLPLPVSSLELEKNPKTEAGSEEGSGVVRIKLVITKQQLEVMLRKGGVSVGDLVTQTRMKENSNKADVVVDENDGSCKGWKPALESIPELD